MLKLIPRVSQGILSVEKVGNRLKLHGALGNTFLSPKGARIVKVSYLLEEEFQEIDTCATVETAEYLDWSYEVGEEVVVLDTSCLHVEIERKSGSISYFDVHGKLLLKERSYESKYVEVYDSFRSIESDETKTRIIDTPDGKKTIVDAAKQEYDKKLYRTNLYFDLQVGEKLFGLGQQENGVFDLSDTTVYLCQKNMRISIPFYQSTNGYGILMDSYAPLTFMSTQNQVHIYTEADVACSYYFIAGESFDEVISGYRYLTGKASLLPKWAYGFIQSFERYETAQELIDTVKRHREEEVGIDCIVLDWMSWEGELWGQKTFDATRFTDPKDMMKQIHDLDAHLMVSIWPNMREGGANHIEMKEKKQLLPNNDNYNAYEQSARDLYWEQANRGLFQYDIDAWWCDSSEPVASEWGHIMEPSEASTFYETYNQSKNIMPNELCNAYALYHAKGIYEGQRSVTQDKRVMNLTRSAYSGQQKYGCCLWSGDISATWEVLRKQVIAGLGFCATGLPYWTFDIGAFFVDQGFKWFWNGDYKDGNQDLGYCELYTRWYQLGTFMPVFRSHGTSTRREIWQFKQGDDTTFYNAIKASNRLRYHLLPTIYSYAYKTWKYDDTILRMLAFDFRDDVEALSCTDEFMFGRNLLVSPVLEPMYYEAGSKPIIECEKTRTLYLPKDENWIDYETREVYTGGQYITKPVTIEAIPMFVKAGSILFTNEYYNHANENTAQEITIEIFRGKNCLETLFLDDGDNYSYEEGNYCEIDFTWTEETTTLSIEKPRGTWWKEGMCIKLTILCGETTQHVTYTGEGRLLLC